VARLSGGSVEAGELLADPEASEARDRFVERAFEAMTAPSLDPLLALAEDAKKEKDELRGRIAALASALAERAASSEAREAAAMAARGRMALAALEHLDGNNAPQLVVEGMLSRMRAV
jgi:hypothetical protein